MQQMIQKGKNIFHQLIEKWGEENILVAITAFTKVSSISLVAISIVWYILELFMTKTTNQNGIDTIIAFLASFAIGFFAAKHAILKVQTKNFREILEKQVKIIKEQQDTVQRLWKLKNQR